MFATVSVVMPSFNSERSIGNAIDSVLRQSHPAFELIVVDGGSNDRTRSVVQELAWKDSRVKLVENLDDRGPAHARYTGIKMSHGKFIAFLDADDYWLPEKLSRQVAFMEQAKVRFTYTYYRRVSGDGKRVGCLVPMRRSYTYRELLTHRGVGTLTVMIDRELLTEDVIRVWRPAGGEELIWWLLILRKGISAHLLNVDLARYRDTAGSLSKNQAYTLRTVWDMYRTELQLARAEAARYYAGYVYDSAKRKLRLKVCDTAKALLEA